MNDGQRSHNSEPVYVPNPSPPVGRPRILVVDDESDIRLLNAEVLRRSGYEVEAVPDGAAAWDVLQMNKFDLLITDNRMPKMTGLELLAKIREAAIPLPAIMASGTLPDLPSADYAPLQIETILPKPYSFEDLLNLVKKVLGRSSGDPETGSSPSDWSGRQQPDGPATA